MFKELKEALLENVNSIIELLEFYGFTGVMPRTKEIRFKRNEGGGLNISIRLDNNPSLIVHDFAHNVSTDIFAYIVQEKDVALRDVLFQTKRVLHLGDDWEPPKKIELFGGFYNRIVNKAPDNTPLPEYSSDILEQYDFRCNRRFWRDGISFETQRFFHIMYDTISNRIVIPLYDEMGRLIGVKGRINESDPGEYVPKYLYLKECQASKYLYGYYQNYQYLFGGDVVVGESEKMVMQAHSFDIRNVVGLGSNSLSERQARLLLQLSPQRIIFALDEGLDIFQTEKNIRVLRSCMGVQNEIDILFWDYTKDPTIKGTKNSPTDMGVDKYNEIINTQLVKVNL